MAEKEATRNSNKRKIRQPPSVPFLWEERPGIAKKDWKPGVSSVTPTLPPPIPSKFIPSDPFNWEEKRGIPLPSFSQPPVEPAAVPPSAMLTLPPPPVYPPAYFNGCNSNDDRGNESDEQQIVFETDLEAFGFETDDSFGSAPSLLANCLVASRAIATAVPMKKTYQIDNTSDHLETPFSPTSETESSTSSYATGTSSLVGASFLECLFPLLQPNSGFLEKVRYPDQESQAQSDFVPESNNTVVIRRPPTLGELIMMSRRKTYQSKAVQIREQHLSMILEAPSFPFPKKSLPQLPEFQLFHLRTLERARQHASNNAIKVPNYVSTSRNENTGLRSFKSFNASKEEKCEAVKKFKACPLNKQIISSKGENGVLQNMNETTATMEFKFLADRRFSDEPPVELFNKLSLSSEVHFGEKFREKMALSEGFKEDEPGPFLLQSQIMNVAKENSQRNGGMQYQCRSNRTTEIGRQLNINRSLRLDII